MDLNRKANELRQDVLRVVYNAGAGHIGGDLSMMEILTTLYYSVISLEQNSKNRISKGFPALLKKSITINKKI